jgi:very-short-patch-repair endonuclease
MGGVLALMTTEEFIKRSRERHDDQFDYSATLYVGFTRPIDLICREHGAFRTTPKAHLYAKSGKCVKCCSRLITAKHQLTTEQFIERARAVHGERYVYDAVDYHGHRVRVTIVCPKHGPFSMKPSRHIGGRGCRKCTSDRLKDERRLSFWDFVERVSTVHGPDRYEYELRDFVNLFSKIPIHCPKHGGFRQSVASHLLGTGCPKCSQSNGERRVREALVTLGVEFVEQARFPECRGQRSLPFDFFVPTHRLLIEFDGRQHYENSELWGGEEKLAQTKRHDGIKTEFAAQNGYHLLRIPYSSIGDIADIVLEKLAVTENVTKEEI